MIGGIGRRIMLDDGMVVARVFVCRVNSQRIARVLEPWI